ncbi:prolyl oligopeptidase family serine peptidase [Roseiconus lacunae]|uniref:prolyl oligopeptidase family serine peptidase n=1 Tax=Roseiconus lacunae TaxID=2605694 RepID=UPI001E5BCBC2|nr:prolyl oligopeptidase family serine peptidase [Roseiconus lacunae]MCD0463035.1 prolyl oligopeptidase family serine peptidase [Roseiconus lacunae]
MKGLFCTELKQSFSQLCLFVSRIVLVSIALAVVNIGAVSNAQPPTPGYKKLPPDGIQIDAADRQRLQIRLDELKNRATQTVQQSSDPEVWYADVAVLTRAVDLAINQNLFFKPAHVNDAFKLLDEADRRLEAVVAGDRGLKLLGFDPDKTAKPQTLVAGFVSRIDDSVQPFGIVVPAGYSLPQHEQAFRTDIWLHGRGDTKTEIPFLTERMNKVGQYAPRDTFVIHPFGRHCNAFKFAGETDVYEALQAAERYFRIDSQRTSIRGFSMGGAGCWHFAVHDPTRWMAANPGAGFVDTIVYQGWQNEMPFNKTPTMEKLLRWYDVLPWANNLRGTNVIAYSGEVDKQKQAADRVAEKVDELGFEFPYVIGAEMGHKINQESVAKIDQQIASWAGDVAPLPKPKVEFVTYTLRYNTADWVRITGMVEHWTKASVKATVDTDAASIEMNTEGVTHLELDFSRSGWAGKSDVVDVTIDGQQATLVDMGNSRGFQCRLIRQDDGEWTKQSFGQQPLRKRPGLQGPIDDAFCERFVIVLPSRPARHGRVQRWIDRETDYLQSRWKRLMRGDIQVVQDRDLTDDQIATCNLICFGDFSSNRVLFNVADSLPIRWTRQTLVVAGKSYDPADHAPVMCFPNPMNPSRYIVVNSGMTFREFSNVSNSRQIAMLPDYAVINVTEEDDSIFPGTVVDQGFFDEQWQFAGGGN